MALVLQDVADMAIDFERSHGYSLPTFEAQYISASNSSNSHRSSKPPTKVCNNCQHDQINPNIGIAKGITSKRIVPTAPKQGSHQPKYKTTKEKQHNLIKTFHKQFQDRRRQSNEISTPSEDSSNDEFNKIFFRVQEHDDGGLR